MVQGVFFNWDPLKVLSVRLHSKSHQKSSKCQNLLTEKKLVVFRGGSVKKDTLYYFTLFQAINCTCILYIQGDPPCQPVSKFWHLELFWWDLLCNLTLRTDQGRCYRCCDFYKSFSLIMVSPWRDPALLEMFVWIAPEALHCQSHTACAHTLSLALEAKAYPVDWI